MRLPRLFRRDRCAVCHLPARLGHHNATHDAHMAMQTGSPVPVDGKPAPRLPWPGQRFDTGANAVIAAEAARYQRDVDALEAHQRKVDAFAAALKEETA